MNGNTIIDGYSNSLVRFHRWRNELDLVYKIMLALGFAALTGLLAQARVALPFSPVPLTGQTFAVLLAGVVLGRWGGISMSMYVGLGAAGVPWFTNWQGGIATLTGATGGFLLGFILAALFVGYATERYVSARRVHGLIPMMLFANFALIYVPGLLVLNVWWNEFIGPIGFVKLLAVGFLPFVVGDLLKVAAASVVAKAVLPIRN
ncbi:MAG: biotin transporter BioY [Thermoplasmatota archaeon]